MIKKHIRIIACSMAICSAISGLCADPNLIGDGGFELPVTGPGGLNSGYLAFGPGSTIGGVWTVVGPPGINNVALIPSTEYTTGSAGNIYFLSQEGSQSLDLSGEWDNSSPVGVQQTISTVAGQTYLLSFYVGAITTPHWAPYNGPAAVNVQVNGTPLLTAVNSDASGDMPTWKLFSSEFTASSSSTMLTFISATTGTIGYNGLDNISLVQVPEPTIGSLLVTAAMAILLGSKMAPRRRW